MKIKINEKEVGLMFAYPCFKSFMEGLYRAPGLYQDDKAQLTPFGVSHLIVCAYENDCAVNKLPVEIGFNEISEWLDNTLVQEGGQQVITDILIEWANSQKMKELVAEAEKKSQSLSTSTGSNPPVTEVLESVHGN